ncbi:hypothetical protein [Alloactinosynnema sp. L-07]|nr:hypothetical protein [Alloactinosynnema sp. L-07]
MSRRWGGTKAWSPAILVSWLIMNSGVHRNRMGTSRERFRRFLP